MEWKMKKLSNFYRVSQIKRRELKERLQSLKLVKLPDGRYDVIENADFSNLRLNSLLEIPIRIRRVTGSFWCDHNHLTSLEGAPEYVGGGFYCAGNELQTLEGAPEYVGGNFDCSSNELKTLKGTPEYIGGSFDCSYNQLTTLEGAPKRVGRDFICFNNPRKFTEAEVRKLVNVRGKVIV